MLKTYFGNKKKNNEIIGLAYSAFSDRYPDRKLLKLNTPPEKIDEDEYIVTVCYGDVKPPKRTWWRIHMEQKEVRELAYEKAAKIIGIPRWR